MPGSHNHPNPGIEDPGHHTPEPSHPGHEGQGKRWGCTNSYCIIAGGESVSVDSTITVHEFVPLFCIPTALSDAPLEIFRAHLSFHLISLILSFGFTTIRIGHNNYRGIFLLLHLLFTPLFIIENQNSYFRFCFFRSWVISIVIFLMCRLYKTRGLYAVFVHEI